MSAQEPEIKIELDRSCAKKDRLNEGLRSLARWCADRSNGDHDTDTTLTMLEKKATALRGRVIAAGWAEIDRKNAIRHNDPILARRNSGPPQQ